MRIRNTGTTWPNVGKATFGGKRTPFEINDMRAYFVSWAIGAFTLLRQ